MELTDCIKSRRAKRLFLDKPIPSDVVEKILEAGIYAPSAKNSQPWHFLVVSDKEKKTALAFLKEENNRDHILSAQVVILICVDTTKSLRRYEEGALAAGNILLAAHNEGLGSVYLTAYKSNDDSLTDSIRELFSLPPTIFPVAILPLGYPDITEIIDEKKLVKLKEITHFNSW